MSHGGGGDRWLVSYADFITLLMVLFVVLYSMGQTDVKRYKELAESLRTAFDGGPLKVVDPSINQSGVGNGDTAPAPIELEEFPERLPDSLDVAGRISEMLAAANMGSEVSVHNNIEGVLISLSEKLLFTSGTAELTIEAHPVIKDVAGMIIPLPNDVRVIGHTDDQPPIDQRYRDNWELSLARALVIVELLIEAGVQPERLIASGKASYDPIFPNDTAAHRALNGRADIIIVYPLEAEVFDLGFFQPAEADNPEATEQPVIPTEAPAVTEEATGH